ncbi:MAG: hypothetical protein R6V85_09030 [Polyangia bacterium]
MCRAYMAVILGALTLFGCGGPAPPPPQPQEPQVSESEQAISIIRRSFDAMGGLERLRLAGAEVKIEADATVGDRGFPVSYMLGGPRRWRLDYVEQGISYVYSMDGCRKIVHDVPARCTPEESLWVTPVRILVGLTFPAGDAAKLDANFTMRDPVTIDGERCAVVQIRPKRSNHRIRAAYSDNSGLLRLAKIRVKDSMGNKTHWEVEIPEWGESKKMRVPWRRTISHGGETIWDERMERVDFDAYDSRAFELPIPPVTDQPSLISFPARRVVRGEVGGQEVEIPAPCPTVGGGAPTDRPTETLPPTEAVRIVHRGPVSSVSSLLETLEGGAMAEGRTPSGDPRVMLLEEPPMAKDPALMILYLPLKSAEKKVEIEGL